MYKKLFKVTFGYINIAINDQAISQSYQPHKPQRIQASTGENTLTFLENYIADSKDVPFYFTIDNVEVSFIDFKDFDNSLLKQTVELELATIVQLNITGGVEINSYATEEE